MSRSGETRIRRLGPGDEDVVRTLAEDYASLGGTRIDSVMWDF